MNGTCSMVCFEVLKNQKPFEDAFEQNVQFMVCCGVQRMVYGMVWCSIIWYGMVWYGIVYMVCLATSYNIPGAGCDRK
jgi:hypothetical protein